MASVKRRRRPTPRGERAANTRRRIVAAAAELFGASGYAATTMSAIAERGGVAVQTVYFIFHTKTALLAAVADLAITGGGADEPAQAPWVREVLAERDGGRRIRLLVEGTAKVIPRMLPVIAAWRAAMASDPAAAAQYRERLLSRRQFALRVAELIRAQGQLKEHLEPARAADLLFVLTTPESFETCTRLLGWSVEEWNDWVTATLTRDLLR